MSAETEMPMISFKPKFPTVQTPLLRSECTLPTQPPYFSPSSPLTHIYQQQQVTTVYIGMERKILTTKSKQKVCALKLWHQKEVRCWFMFYGYLLRLAYWFCCCRNMCAFINGGNCGAAWFEGMMLLTGWFETSGDSMWKRNSKEFQRNMHLKHFRLLYTSTGWNKNKHHSSEAISS